MRRYPVILAILLAAGNVRGEPPAQAVRLGDSAAAVRAALGEPRGSMKGGSREVLYYPRGKVEIKDGAVVALDLVSEEELARRLEAQHAEGEALRDRMSGDPAFLAQGATGQMAFWQRFHATYPTVALDNEALAALAAEARLEEAARARAAELAAQKQRDEEHEREMLRMKWRIMDAEERAQRAELAAKQARDRFYTYGYYPPWQLMPGGTAPVLVVPSWPPAAPYAAPCPPSTTLSTSGALGGGSSLSVEVTTPVFPTHIPHHVPSLTITR